MVQLVHHWGKSSQESRGKNWSTDHRGLLTFLWFAQLPFYIGQARLPRHGTAMVGCPCLYKLAIKKNPMGQSDGDSSSAEGISFQVTLFCVTSSSIPKALGFFPSPRLAVLPVHSGHQEACRESCCDTCCLPWSEVQEIKGMARLSPASFTFLNSTFALALPQVFYFLEHFCAAWHGGRAVICSMATGLR